MHVWNFAEYTEPETLHSALVLIVGKLNYVFVEALSGSFGLIILIIRRFRVSDVASSTTYSAFRNYAATTSLAPV